LGGAEVAHRAEITVAGNLKDMLFKRLPKVKQSATGEGLIEAAITENVHQSTMDIVAHSEILRNAKEQPQVD
jgi:hypothetical protein